MQALCLRSLRRLSMSKGLVFAIGGVTPDDTRRSGTCADAVTAVFDTGFQVFAHAW